MSERTAGIYSEATWSRVLKYCLELGFITPEEFSSECESVAGWREFPTEVEALLRLLADKGFADPKHTNNARRPTERISVATISAREPLL
jgi:hypothetical protein